MKQRVFNVAATTATELIDINQGLSNIRSMTIANTDASDTAVVNLYLKNAGGTDYYIFKNLNIPFGQTLKLEPDEVSFDNRVYNFYIYSTKTVTVIINE
tara:strand:+ start:156 stop:452 length:297 start_codon:yes stop_codon:yes gene_type:complete